MDMHYFGLAPKMHYFGLTPKMHYFGLGGGGHGLSPLAFLLMLAALVTAAGIIIRWRVALARR